MGVLITQLPYVNAHQTERTSYLRKASDPLAYIQKLHQENGRADRFREKQEVIVLKKLEKEAEIRRRNEEIQQKWEKMQTAEGENKREMMAKVVQMASKREAKIQGMKKAEKEKERQLQREHEELSRQLHEKAKNITVVELERQKIARKKEEENQKKQLEVLRRKEQQEMWEEMRMQERLRSIEQKCILTLNAT